MICRHFGSGCNLKCKPIKIGAIYQSLQYRSINIQRAGYRSRFLLSIPGFKSRLHHFSLLLSLWTVLISNPSSAKQQGILPMQLAATSQAKCYKKHPTSTDSNPTNLFKASLNPGNLFSSVEQKSRINYFFAVMKVSMNRILADFSLLGWVVPWRKEAMLLPGREICKITSY